MWTACILATKDFSTVDRLIILPALPRELAGKLAAVMGRSQLVGLPISRMLLLADATVISMHSKTQRSKELTRQADILIVAVGQPHLVDKTWVKHGAVVIDVGINRSERGLIGDVNMESMLTHVKKITPVPGGVGPMTIACLLRNTVQAWETGEQTIEQ